MRCVALGLSVSLTIAVGCDSGGSRVDFRMRLAPSDSACTVEDSGSLAGDIVVRICSLSGADCVPLSEESSLLRAPIDRFESEPIDIPETSEPLRVDIQVCQGEDVIAFASAPQVRLDAGLDIVLHRTRSTSCGTSLLPRAFGEAVTLPNGQVLVFGGVEVNLQAAQGEVGPMVEAIEIYDPTTDKSRVIDGTFRGAFGSTMLLSSQGNEHRIRVFGGLDAEGGSAAFQLNRLVRTGFFGLPVQPTADTTYAPVRDLIYDADAEAVQVEVLPNVDGTGFNTGTRELATFGVDSTGLPVGAGARTASSGTLDLFSTSVARLGNSTTDVGNGSTVLWGGPILEPGDDVQANAGEVLNTTTLTSTLLEAPLEEIPTAFHEAGSLVAGQVLLAGGLQSICDEVCQLNVSQIYSVTPLRVMTIDGQRLPVAGTPIEPAVFQASATTKDAWIVSGGTGSTVAEERKQFAFEPNAQVTVVTEELGAYSARPSTPLRHPRFGHAMAGVDDSAGIVFGGIELQDGGFVAATAVERVVVDPSENLCVLSAPSP